MKRNEDDIRILQAVIREQNEKGAALPVNPDSYRYSWNLDGRLTGIDWNGCGLKDDLSLAGLDGLKTLDCSGCLLEALDISRNPKLTAVYCNYNQLGKLDTSGNPDLKELQCHDNALSTLDLSRNPKLKFLLCYYNQLKHLDTSANPALMHLDCSYNQLEVLCVDNPGLKCLSCEYNPLKILDTSACPALTELDCSHTRLKAFDAGVNRELEKLDCSYNPLESMDVSGCPALKELYCSHNRIAALDISKNPELEWLYCEGNPLETLDTRANQLECLRCDADVRIRRGRLQEGAVMRSSSYIATPPGAAIREQINDRGMSTEEFADRMGMSGEAATRLINGEALLTPETAVRLEAVLGVPAGFWNKLEAVFREKMKKAEAENEEEMDYENEWEIRV